MFLVVMLAAVLVLAIVGANRTNAAIREWWMIAGGLAMALWSGFAGDRIAQLLHTVLILGAGGLAIAFVIKNRHLAAIKDGTDADDLVDLEHALQGSEQVFRSVPVTAIDQAQDPVLTAKAEPPISEPAMPELTGPEPSKSELTEPGSPTTKLFSVDHRPVIEG